MTWLTGSSIAVAGLMFIVVFGSALAGIYACVRLPKRYQTADTKDAVKLAAGVVSTLSALVIGLLVASAKSSFDAKSTQVRQITANVLLLDFVLSQYGPDALQARQLLRRGVGPLVDRVWGEGSGHGQGAAPSATTEAEAFYRIITELSPRDERLRGLQARAIQLANDIGQARSLLFTQTGGSIPPPFLAVLVSWLAAIFASFGLLTRPNPVAIAALFIAAAAVSGSIFLILELDRAFGGIMQIPSGPLRHALSSLG